MSQKYLCFCGLALSWALSIRPATAQTEPPAAPATPEARAAARAAEAGEQEADAASEPMPLEVMLEIWGVPVDRLYAIDDADMIRIAVEQELQAPGTRSSQKRAAALRSASLRAEGAGRSRALALRLAHAHIDHQGAIRSHRIHLEHLQLMERTADIARARHAAGAALADVTVAEVETARAASLVAADEARAQTSRELTEALRGAGKLEATRERPELVALRAARDAELAQAEAERKRNGWPAPRVGLSYFPPSGDMSEHALGITLGMKLPWLWGARSGAEHAAAGRARALAEELTAKQRDIALEVVEARGAVSAASSALAVLRQRVLPATQRARDLARAGYASGQERLEQVLATEARHVDTLMQIVELENELAHRHLDLDFALGRSESRPTIPAEKNHAH